MDRAQAEWELTRLGAEFEMVEDRSRGYPLRYFKNAPRSMRELLKATAAYADRTYVIYEDEAYSFREHLERVASLAHYLRSCGIEKGDRVAIGMRNYPEWVFSFWACQAIGAITVSLNAWWTGVELEFALRDSAPAALLLDGERLERIGDRLTEMDLKALLVTRRLHGQTSGTDFADILTSGPHALPDVDVDGEDLATILYTSGTTGQPKGACASHLSHVTNMTNMRFWGALSRKLAGVSTPPAGPQMGVLQTFPCFHIAGLNGIINALSGGLKLALSYKWSPIDAVRLIEKHRLNLVNGVPIVIRQLLEANGEIDGDLSSLAGLSVGGAPVPPDLVRKIEEQFGSSVAPGNGYGLTETFGIIVGGGSEYRRHPDSVGRPMPTVDIRLVGDDGTDVATGEIGEIWARGSTIVSGYWNNPAATEIAFSAGWFRSGDLGYQTPDGLYYIADRMKDVIIRGGENVYCVEVEAALLEIAGVKDAAVIGIPDELYGEQVAAVIQIDGTAPLDADALCDTLRHRLAKFKIPSVVQSTTVDLPRNAAGKILKRELRERFQPDAVVPS